MTIPIRNLYYLFLYAWAQFPGGAVAEVGIDESPDLPNLFGKLLSAGTRRLFRRGLDRGYTTFTDELAGPHGRLRLDRIVKEMTELRGTAVCDFDELTHDVLHNQVLKATLMELASCPDVEKETRHDLRSLVRRFHDVADIRLSASCFRKRRLRKVAYLISVPSLFLSWYASSAPCRLPLRARPAPLRRLQARGVVQARTAGSEVRRRDFVG
jgi:5-methylcytosine-specific restriction enzyme subunit McrC